MFNYIMLAVTSMLIGFLIGINWDKKNTQTVQRDLYPDLSKTVKSKKANTVQPKSKKSNGNVIQFNKYTK